jgi:hypothetical protein
MNGPDVSPVSRGLAEMHIGAKKRGRRRDDYSEYRVKITIHTPVNPFPGLDRSAIKKLEETLSSKLEESLGIDEGNIPRVIPSVEQGERPRVSVLVYTVDGSIIEQEDKTALSEAGIENGILLGIQKIAPDFDTTDIVVKYPEVRIYTLDIQLYASSESHPKIELGAYRPVSGAFAYPIEIDSKSGLSVLCTPVTVSFTKSSEPPRVRVAVLRGDGSVLGDKERAAFNEATTSTFLVERIRSAIKGIDPTLAEVPIEIAYQRAPQKMYKVEVTMYVDEDKHPVFREKPDTGLKRALEARLGERGISAGVSMYKIKGKHNGGPSIVLTVSSAATTGPSLTPIEIQKFEASGIGELTRTHIAAFDPTFPVPDHIGISNKMSF